MKNDVVPVEIRGILPANSGCAIFVGNDKKVFVIQVENTMGHVIGIGTIWEDKGLLVGAGSNNPQFTGINARRAYGQLRGTGPITVPVENTGGAGTRDGNSISLLTASKDLFNLLETPSLFLNSW